MWTRGHRLWGPTHTRVSGRGKAETGSGVVAAGGTGSACCGAPVSSGVRKTLCTQPEVTAARLSVLKVARAHSPADSAQHGTGLDRAAKRPRAAASEATQGAAACEDAGLLLASRDLDTARARANWSQAARTVAGAMAPWTPPSTAEPRWALL